MYSIQQSLYFFKLRIKLTIEDDESVWNRYNISSDCTASVYEYEIKLLINLFHYFFGNKENNWKIKER